MVCVMHRVLAFLEYLTALLPGHTNYISLGSMKAPSGYTSVLPESSGSAEDSAYAMASAMENHQVQGSFHDDKSAGVELSSSPISRFRRPKSQALAQYTLGPFTSAVSESSPTSDAAANNWASAVFMRHGGSEEKAQRSLVQLHSDVKAREQQLSSYGQATETSKVHLGQSAAVREGPAKHDQRAWGWAVDALEHHRDQVQRAKFIGKLASTAAEPAVAAAPAQLDTKLQRMYKLRAARAAMMDVHETTQQGESHDFAKDQEKAQLREAEVRPGPRARCRRLARPLLLRAGC